MTDEALYRLWMQKEPPESGRYLCDLRYKLGMSRGEAAKLAGCTAQTIGRYERNGLPRGIRINRLVGLCRAYGLTLEHLYDLMQKDAAKASA